MTDDALALPLALNLLHSHPHSLSLGAQAESTRAPLRNTTLLVFEVLSPFARHRVYASLFRRFNSKTSTSGTRCAPSECVALVFSLPLYLLARFFRSVSSPRSLFVSLYGIAIAVMSL